VEKNNAVKNFEKRSAMTKDLCSYLEKEPEIHKLLEKESEILELINNREVEGDILRILEKDPEMLTLFKEIKANQLISEHTDSIDSIYSPKIVEKRGE